MPHRSVGGPYRTLDVFRLSVRTFLVKLGTSGASFIHWHVKNWSSRILVYSLLTTVHFYLENFKIYSTLFCLYNVVCMWFAIVILVPFVLFKFGCCFPNWQVESLHLILTFITITTFFIYHFNICIIDQYWTYIVRHLSK